MARARAYSRCVAQLDAADRAKLPNSAFAYIDSLGKRRLPIHDAAHVRNALARFGQVHFEDDAARDRARERLLRAAKRFGIVPVGFIAGQLESERARGTRGAVILPSGFVTMLLTDIEASTALLERLGDGYGDLLTDVRSLLQDTATGRRGSVVETRADEFFAAFASPAAALETAIAVQRLIRERSWPDGLEVRVRIGIHSGYPTLKESNYIGMAVHTAARVSAAAHGGQILTSGDTREALTGLVPDGVTFRRLGEFRLRGITAPVALHQVRARGLASRFPPPRSAVDVRMP
jgi:class 3 adenylate cyclase